MGIREYLDQPENPAPLLVDEFPRDMAYEVIQAKPVLSLL